MVIDRGGGRVGSEHFGLHVIELRRFRAAAASGPRPEDRWLHFLAEAEGWRAVPPLHHSRPLEAAMTLLHSIRADPKERALLDAYNKRLSIDATIAEELAEARAEAKAERERAEAMVQRVEEELRRAEEERHRTEEERQRAEEGRHRAEQERHRAEQERHRAEEEREQAEEERQRAEAAVEALRAKLRAAGIDPDAAD